MQYAAEFLETGNNEYTRKLYTHIYVISALILYRRSLDTF